MSNLKHCQGELLTCQIGWSHTEAELRHYCPGTLGALVGPCTICIPRNWSSSSILCYFSKLSLDCFRRHGSKEEDEELCIASHDIVDMESERDVLISNPMFDCLSLEFVFKIITITSLVVEMMSLTAALTFYLVRPMVRLLMMVEMSTGGQSLYSTDPTESSLYSPAPHEQFQHSQCLQPISSTTL